MFDKWFKKKEDEKLQAVESIKEIPSSEPVGIVYDMKMPAEVKQEINENPVFLEVKAEMKEESKSEHLTAIAELKEKDKNICNIVTDQFELRLKTEDTTIEECENIGLWDKLRATLLDKDNGFALTANQIGIRKKAFLVCLREEGKVKKEMKFVNPVILDQQKPIRFDGEGCLSVPDKFINTARYAYIKVKDDVNGEKEYHDYLAVILQHEIDHLNGILFTDRALPVPFKRTGKKVGRNDPCPCGSGKKYKKCCLK